MSRLLFGIGLVGLVFAFVMPLFFSRLRGLSLGIFILLVSVVAMGLGAEGMQAEYAATCAAKGGEAAFGGRGSMLCLKAGSVVK